MPEFVELNLGSGGDVVRAAEFVGLIWVRVVMWSELQTLWFTHFRFGLCCGQSSRLCGLLTLGLGGNVVRAPEFVGLLWVRVVMWSELQSL